MFSERQEHRVRSSAQPLDVNGTNPADKMTGQLESRRSADENSSRGSQRHLLSRDLGTSRRPGKCPVDAEGTGFTWGLSTHLKLPTAPDPAGNGPSQAPAPPETTDGYASAEQI